MVSRHTIRTALPRSGALLLCAVTTGGLAASPPRILQVSAAKTTSPALIREPSAVPEITTTEPPPRTSRRSEFVPIAVPEPAAPPPSPLPQLAPTATFPAEGPAASPQISSNVPNDTGPQLAPPPAQAAPQTTTILPASSAVEPPGVTYQLASTSAPSPALPRSPSSAMQAVAERALAKAEQASTMAQRGMLYSARTELIEALTLIAQSLDVEQATSAHATALAAGLNALQEAKDFARSGSQAPASAAVAAIAAGHRTTLFHNAAAAPMSPVIAQQQYFGYAQEQVAQAAGQLPAASQILYRLGRLQTALAAHDADSLALHGPQAIVFHQAALITDRGNWLAANELGVLYTRYGQLAAAKEMLLASVTLHPHVAGWQNLAVVHRRLGENDLASRADYERQALAKSGGSVQDASQVVRWVDTKTFAASGANDVRWPADVAAKPAAGATTRK